MTAPRIVFFITGLGTGGAEHMLLKLLKRARQASLQTMVVSLKDEGTLGSQVREAGAELVCCHLNGLMGPSHLVRAFRAVKDFNPTILQGWMYHGNVIASLFGRLLKRRPSVYWSIRQTLYSSSDGTLQLRTIIKLLAALSPRVSGVIYNSLASMHHHQREGMISRRDVVIPNGIDLERFRPDARKGHGLRAKLGIPEHAPVVGCVARVHPMKDHRTFAFAARLLCDRIPDVRFLLAGTGTDSGQMTALLEEAGIKSRTVRLGPVVNSEDIFPAMDALVLSSAWGEGWPNVIGEAMSCEVLCIATAIGEVKEIIADVGFVVRPRDPSAIADACENILLMDLQHRRQLAAKARERIATCFDIGDIFDRHLAIWLQGSALEIERA